MLGYVASHFPYVIDFDPTL
jgi:NADH dehydrogenase [ubiquinone] 1 alpha subcomplex assembly factor 6